MSDRRTMLRTRFLILVGLRWVSAGLIIPVLVLFTLDRGFSLAEFGAAAALQTVVVLALELPTGGLADVIGARRVLTVAYLANVASLAVLVVARSLPLLMVVWLLQGLYRALESGPLEAWYVSTALAEDPDADIERDLSKAGTVTGLAIAGGSLASSALVAVAPAFDVEPLLLPILLAIGIAVVNLVALEILVGGAAGAGASAGADGVGAVGRVRSDGSPAGELEGNSGAVPATLVSARRRIGRSLAEVRTVVADSVKLVAGSVALLALLGVEVLWGIGLIGFETLFPPRLAEVLDAPESAARLLGPIGTGAFLLMAIGSSQVPRMSQRIGQAKVGLVLRVVQGLTVLAMGLLGGPVLIIGAYLATMAVHGASNVVHSAILHGQTDSAHRATVISANSMAGHLGGGIGSIGLGFIAAGAGLTVAMIIAAALLAAAAPLYLLVGPGSRPMSQPDISPIAP